MNNYATQTKLFLISRMTENIFWFDKNPNTHTTRKPSAFSDKKKDKNNDYRGENNPFIASYRRAH
jgi:hypothetical protein